MEKHLIDNLYISNNSTEILDFLADNELMPKDFTRSRVISFQKDQDFYLILFLKNENSDEFVRFEFTEFARNIDSLRYISAILNQMAEGDYNTFKPAQRKIEEMIYMVPVYRALFGYKNDAEDFEFPSYQNTH